MAVINPAEVAALAKAEQESWWHRGMRQILFRLLDPLVAGRSIHNAVDAGWGTGYFARILQARYDWRVFPLAFDWEGQCGVDRMARADVRKLPFPDASFDAAFSIDILSNVPHGDEVPPLQELVRVLEPQGLLVLRLAAFDLFHSKHSEYLGEHQRYRRDRLIRLMEACGLRVLRMSYVNCLLSPIALAKFRIWEPLMRTPPTNGLAPIPGWLDQLFYTPLALESYWLRAGLNFPIGQTILVLAEKA